MVPSGASTGKFEAVELRDGNREEYLGQSVKKAVENINTRLADAIIGENALNQAWIDHLLIETDGTENKSSAGANATLAVSLAAARAAAGALRLPLYQYLGGCHTMQLPVPMMNIFKRGKACGQYGRSSGVYDQCQQELAVWKRVSACVRKSTST